MIFLSLLCVKGMIAQDSLKNRDALLLTQLDGSQISIVAYGDMYVSYTETIDGYTIVRNNEGIYEYAELTRDGNLKADGTKANDPEYREEKELKHLEKKEKHLRFQPPYLNEMKEKKDRFFNRHKYAPEKGKK